MLMKLADTLARNQIWMNLNFTMLCSTLQVRSNTLTYLLKFTQILKVSSMKALISKRAGLLFKKMSTCEIRYFVDTTL